MTRPRHWDGQWHLAEYAAPFIMPKSSSPTFNCDIKLLSFLLFCLQLANANLPFPVHHHSALAQGRVCASKHASVKVAPGVLPGRYELCGLVFRNRSFSVNRRV